MTDDGVPVDAASQVEQLTQGLVFALMTANEQPYPLAVPAAQRVAQMMFDCGVRQTGEKVAEVVLPGWITERTREESAEVPVEPDHFAEQESDRVGVAPEPPKKITAKMTAVEG